MRIRAPRRRRATAVAPSERGSSVDSASTTERVDVAAISHRAVLVAALAFGTAAAIVITLWYLAFTSMAQALDETGDDARGRHLEAIAREVGVLLYFTYSHATSLSHAMLSHVVTPGTFSDHAQLEPLLERFFERVMEDAHLASVDADGAAREHHNVIASGVMYAGLPHARMDQCNNASFATVVRAPDGSGAHLSDVQLWDANASAGGGAMVRQLRLYDAASNSLGAVVAPDCSSDPSLEPPACLRPLDCATTMAPLWMAERQPAFGDFAWFGPYDPGVGWGQHFEANLPLADARGESAGRIAMAVSLRGLTALLQRQLDEGGEITRGALALLFTRNGERILGNTEARGAAASAAAEAAQVPAAASYALDDAHCDPTFGCSLRALPNASLLADAVRVVRARSDGAACPDARWLANATDESLERLVSVKPFDTADYGMPPLDAPWCVITSIPSANALRAVRRASVLSSFVALAGASGVAIAVIALGYALYKSRRRAVELTRLAEDAADELVADALASVADLRFPMVLVPVDALLAHAELLSHEAWRARGELVFLDTIEQLKEFRAHSRIIFVSHQCARRATGCAGSGARPPGSRRGVPLRRPLSLRARAHGSPTHARPHGHPAHARRASRRWLSRVHPDPSGVQFGALQRAVRAIVGGAVTPAPCAPVAAAGGSWYVWLDWSSVPQTHRGLQLTAIASLPVYACNADVFLILAPRATHEHTGERCGIYTYISRGWCRLEVLAKVCGSGLAGTYIARHPVDTAAGGGAAAEDDAKHDAVVDAVVPGAVGVAEPAEQRPSEQLEVCAFTRDELDSLSLHVFEGSFLDESDKLRLVSPVLGLYGHILRSDEPDAVHMREHIERHKERFFPKAMTRADGSREPLFRDYISRVEAEIARERLEAGLGAARPSASSNVSRTAAEGRTGVASLASFTAGLHAAVPRVESSGSMGGMVTHGRELSALGAENARHQARRGSRRRASQHINVMASLPEAWTRRDDDATTVDCEATAVHGGHPGAAPAAGRSVTGSGKTGHGDHRASPITRISLIGHGVCDMTTRLLTEYGPPFWRSDKYYDEHHHSNQRWQPDDPSVPLRAT